MSEEQHYKIIQEQVAHLLDQAANDQHSDGMIGLGAVWLASEMYVKNEQAHERHKQRKEKRRG